MTALAPAVPAQAAVKAPLAAHLREARNRGLRAAIALVIGVVAGYAFSGALLEVLRAPIVELAASRNASLNYDSITGAFDLKLKIAIYAGIVLSSPVWLYEVLAFLAPGLTRREKKYTFGFLGAALPLVAAGCLAGFLLFPRMVALLASFADSADSTLLQASYYVDFVLKIVLATGIAFVIIGPHRMPQYAQSAARLIRTITGAVAASRSRAEEIVGSAIPTEDWKKLDPRQYDPRRTIREAWAQADAVPDVVPEPARGRWVVAGTSAHPRRVWVPEEQAPAEPAQREMLVD